MAAPAMYRLNGDEEDEFGDLESPGFRRQHFAPPPPGAAPPQPQSAPAAASAAAGLGDEEFSRQWMMGLASERSLGRPKEWNGKEEGFDTFAFRFSNWLGSMPGNAEELLEASALRDSAVLASEFGFRVQVMAKGVMQSLKSLVDGKALDIVKSVTEKGNGFEAWRRLWREYRPHTAGRKVTMLEAVMEDKPRDGEDFGTWYHRWLELIRQAEVARGRLIDDDVKVAVAMRRAPRELRDHLMLQSAHIGDRFSIMGDIITTWMIARKSYQTPKEQAPVRDPNAMEIGAMSHWQPYGKSDGKGKSYGKSGGKGGKFHGKSYGESYGKGGKSYGKGGKSYGKSGKSHGKSYGKGGKSYGKGDGKSYGKGPSSFTAGTFHGYCGGCWEWGHKKAHCPSRASRMEIGAMSGASSTAPPSTRSTTVFSDPGTSVSQRIGALSSIAETWEDEDWPDEDFSWWSDDWHEPWWDSWQEEEWQPDEWEHSGEELYIMTLGESAHDAPPRRLVDTAGADGVWMFMIDSGSQSTACQPEFAPQYGIDDSEVARLRDIQDRLIPAYGKKVVDVRFLGDKCESVDGSLKLDVSDVGKNVASMGRLLRAGFDLHFTNEGHDCWMEKGGQRIQILEDSAEAEAPLYSLRLQVREPPPTRTEETSVDRLLVAPVSAELVASGIVGCSVELAGLTKHPAMNGRRGRVVRIRDDRGEEDWVVVQLVGGGSINARPANLKRLDEPIAEAPAAIDASAKSPVVLRAPGEIPSRAVVESHNLTHLPTAPWCEICIAAKAGMDHFHTAAAERTMPEVQVDYFYLSSTGELCVEQQAKATFLSMVDVEQGYVAALQVQKKGDEHFAIRFLSSFLDRMRCDEVKLKYDNEPGMKQLVHMVRNFRSPRKTTLEPIIRAEHEMLGAAERAHRTLGANTRALMMDVKVRTSEEIIPGHVLFPWMVRHVGWSITRFQPHGSRGQTSYESRTGTAYKSALVNFAETVMIRVPIDPPGLRRKLDTQWLKGTWVGRTDESDAHIVLTSHGVVTGRSVRRLPAELRFQADLVRGLKAKVSDPVLSQAKLLRILPASMPIRLDGETEALEEAAEVRAEVAHPVAADPMAVEPLVNEEAAGAVELLPAPVVDMDTGAEELLGDAMATEADGDDLEPPTRRQRMAAIMAAIGDDGEQHPTTDSVHYEIPKLRTEESIMQTRAEHIKYLLESKSVKDWPRDTAMQTGAKLLSGRFVDDPVKEKSRYCAREFATVKDPTVFAAASDVDATACVDLFAVKHDYPTLCFDAVAAFSQADEQELVFLECPKEHLESVGKDVVWQCLKVREGRRSGARSWQEHFLATLTDAACPGAFVQNPKSPSLYHSASLKVLLDLHVDDGYAAGPPESLKQVFDYLSTVLVLKISPLVKYGMAFDHVGTTRFRTSEGMWIQTHDKYVAKVLEMLGMTSCNASTSPKLDKAHMEDDDQPCEKAALFRTAVCTLLYASKRKPEIQSTIRWLCKRLRAPTKKAWRQLVKLARYMKGSRGLCTFFPAAGEVTHIAGFLDGDWACDDIDRKSVSGGIAMVAGCRMHNHSRGTADHALSSGESEIMSASEMLKECLLLQFNLQFAGFGLIPIILHTDATVCRQFVHKKGIGRMKHLDVRHCWLQDQLTKGAYTMKKVAREFNPSDMMTHSPSAAELQKFLPMVGLFERACADGPVEIVRTALAVRPSGSVKLAAAVLAYMAGQAKSETCPAVRFQSAPYREQSDWQYILAMMLFVAGLVFIFGVLAGWKLRAWWESMAPQAAGAAAPRAAPLAIVDAPRSPRGLEAAQPRAVATRTMNTQSQTRYTYWTENPRFVPLGEREQGCWELAR